MSAVTSPFVVVTFAAGLLSLAMGVAVLRRERRPISAPLVVMLFAVAAWALPYGLSLTCRSLDCVLFWQRLRYPGVVVAPVAYLVVALRYGGHDRWCRPGVYALLGVIPAISLALVWTNPVHGLFWETTDLARVGAVSVLDATAGPWRPVFLGYFYAITALALGVLAANVIRTGPVYRKQALLMFLGGVVPLTIDVLTESGGPAGAVSLTTPAIAITGIAFALALFRFDLLAVRPVARDRLFRDIDDGVVVAGPDGRIRDINPVASEVFPEAARGRPLDEVVTEGVAADGGELTVETDAGERVFRVESTPLLDDDESVGRIVRLQDITEVARREQRISVLNRVLRHNIRNELNVVKGSLTAVESTLPADHDAREHLARAREHTEGVAKLADRARVLERTLRQRDTAVAVPISPLVRAAVERVGQAHPDAEFHVSLPNDDIGTMTPGPDSGEADGADVGNGATDEGDATVRAVTVTEQLLSLAVEELVENAVVHNDAPAPRVRVEVAATEAAVAVRIADDGPGIPEMQTRVLSERTESPLNHGQGLGLWLAEWVASQSGGELSFPETDSGTVVQLRLQRPVSTTE